MEEKPKISVSEEAVFRDWLSEMPDEVIVHILSFLPTLDAVRTVLLCRFGYLWTLVPTLSFDMGKYCEVIFTDGKSQSYNEEFSCIARFVRNVLMIHRRFTIDSFQLFMDVFGDEFKYPNSVGDIKMWLRFAVHRQVEMYCRYDAFDELVLPNCIFESQSLVRLELHRCTYKPQRQMLMGSLRRKNWISH